MKQAFYERVGKAITGESLVLFAARLRRLEERLLRKIRKHEPRQIAGERKPWKEIARKPEAQGRDELVLALQKKGFTYRMSRRLVKVILEVCRQQLSRGRLETPIGTWTFAVAPKPREHTAFGYSVKTYKKRWWITFLPVADLRIQAQGAYDDDDIEEEEDDEVAEEDQVAACPRCGSTWLMEAEFRQYIDAYGATPGSDIFAAEGPSFPLRLCLCGEPIGPKLKRRDITTIPGLADFLDSVERARQHRTQAGAVDQKVAEIAKEVASFSVQDGMNIRLTNVEAALKKRGWNPTDEF
ncbi:MAG TPA: hypothetical protein VN736_10360 [Candidatus Limnocylindrales bacterium]|nr:hypothetical protein [Candidatus Limnocylindrales bacterium]